jgi:hypothetical protein
MDPRLPERPAPTRRAPRRIVLQTPIEVDTAQSQDIRFAIPCQMSEEALIWVNVHKNSSGATVNLEILGSSSTTLPNPSSSSFWTSLRTISVSAAALGAFSASYSGLPDFLSWKISGLTGAVLFEIVVYLYDA